MMFEVQPYITIWFAYNLLFKLGLDTYKFIVTNKEEKINYMGG